MTLGPVHDRHGELNPTTCYNYGCRHPDCRAAMTLSVKRYKVRRSRHGTSLKMSATPWRTALREAVRAGVNLHALSRLSGVPYQTVSNIHLGRVAAVHVSTAERLAEPLRDMVERQVYVAKHAMNLVLCVVEPAPPVEKDTRTWPVEPLKAAVVARYGSVKSALDANRRRDFHRVQSLSTVRAEAWCRDLDLLPDDVWGPAWWGVGEEEAG